MSIKIGKPVVVSDMQGPCAEGYHIPLSSERNGLYNLGVTIGAWTNTGVSNFKDYLMIPSAGSRQAQDASVYGQDTVGFYWSCSPYTDGNQSYALVFNLGFIFPTEYYPRSTGFSIRAFNNTFVAPTSSWTTIYQGTGSAGIFWNQTDGIISITSDGSTGYTIQDKNLGATTVYSNGDTLSEPNCGKYYQWGNNYGFVWTGTVTTSNTQVNAQSYGPSNYYSSSTYITRSSSPYGWDSSNNTNLRGGVSQGTTTVNKEVKNIYVWVDEELPYLCFTANTANSTVQLVKNGSPTSVSLEVSGDLEIREPYTFGNTITLSSIGSKVYWRNTSTSDTGFSTSASAYYQFAISGLVYCSGDISSLINKSLTTSTSSFCFFRLFRGCSILSLPDLPATTLADNCYNQMFYGCTDIYLSDTQTGSYQTPYRIPKEGTGTAGTNALYSMFTSTGGTFTGTPTINTTYYTYSL